MGNGTELLGGYPLVIEAPIAWGDMDAMRHVNNTVYFRWFESARIAYFNEVGLLEIMERTGVGPILAATDCRFRLPLAHPGTVGIGTRVSEIGADRFLMDYLVVGRESGKRAAEGHGLIVTFDYRQGRKAPLPEELRTRIDALEKGAGNRPRPMPARA